MGQERKEGGGGVTLPVDLQPEIEACLRAEAVRSGLTLEQLAAQRLMEAEFLWRIRTSVPAAETRELHRLLRRGRAGRLTEQGRVRRTALAGSGTACLLA